MNFELPGLMQDDYLIVLSNNFVSLKNFLHYGKIECRLLFGYSTRQ